MRCALNFEACSDTVLFGFSDRPVQQAMGILREQQLPRNS
jgi:gentisate 1,2-dioxygenase